MSIVAIAVVGVGTGVYSGYQQYKAGKEADKISKQRAIISEQQAQAQVDQLDQELLRGAESQQEAFAKQQMSSIALGGTGSENDTSSLMFQSDLVEKLFMNNLDNKYLQSQALTLGTNEANLERWRGDATRIAARNQGISTALNSAVSSYGMYAGYQAQLDLASQLKNRPQPGKTTG